MNEQIYVRHPNSPNRSIKLPIIYNGDLCIALSKPANFPCKGERFSILEQIWAGLQRPSIGRLGLEHPDVVYNLEDGASGILLIAKNKEATKILKNAYGSYLFEFAFDLLCEKSPCNKETEIACSLPIARHTSKEMMLISAKMGKKSYTAFNFIESVDRYEHWQAKCTYLRR
ncbi:MAG: hypothetical protein LBF25_00845, partial [Puniceicoccales bacterium]|nr:hypothetical protein [Puniceicoccales bacterium]